jgi:hypothetical protein
MQPNVDSIQLQLMQWSSKCSFALGEYFDLCKPFLLGEPKIDPKLQFVLSQLFISCHLTSESVFILIGNVKLWDSDILIRAVIEGTFKYLFLCAGNKNEQQIKLKEYWDDIPEINRIKSHLRIQEFLSKIDAIGENSKADEWKPLRDLLLNSDELGDLQSRYPRRVRQQIEQKWSFNEIAHFLSKPENDLGGYSGMKNMDFFYGMASHMVHQDADAISIIWDRNRREPERLSAIELAHGARGLSDLIAMAAIRSVATLRLHEKDIKPVKELSVSHQSFLNEMDTAYKIWFDIEYKKYGN